MKNEPIRILCVFSSLDRGGAESMCMSLYRNIDRTKVQFDFVKHSSGHGDFEDEIISLGGRIFEAPRYNIKNHFSYCKWWKNHLKNHPEHRIIHGHFFTISAVYFKIAKKMQRITVAHSHTSTIKITNLKSFIKSRMLKKIEKYSDYRFACSNQSGKWLFPNKEFKVLNNAVDAEKFKTHFVDRDSLNLNIKNDDLVIGVVGSMTDVKNPIETLKIFSKVKEKRENAILLWIGDGSMHKETEEKINELSLQDSVRLLGIRSDVPTLMQVMDALIMPSLYEGLSVTLVEAQSAGLKCFVSDTVSRETDLTGRLVFIPLGDENNWAKIILEADLSKVDTLENIKSAGYDIKTTASYLQNFYIDIS